MEFQQEMTSTSFKRVFGKINFSKTVIQKYHLKCVNSRLQKSLDGIRNTMLEHNSGNLQNETENMSLLKEKEKKAMYLLTTFNNKLQIANILIINVENQIYVMCQAQYYTQYNNKKVLNTFIKQIPQQIPQQIPKQIVVGRKKKVFTINEEKIINMTYFEINNLHLPIEQIIKLKAYRRTLLNRIYTRKSREKKALKLANSNCEILNASKILMQIANY
jgi:hypothetical protein